MWQLILGTAGFVLYFVYDINSILSKNVCLQKFFALGSILVVASVVAEFCGPEFEVTMVSCKGDYKTVTLEELLPYAFSMKK